jgi:hypothetical protein
MAESQPRRITKRERREAELHMTGRPPASVIGMIGFVPAIPTHPVSAPRPVGDTSSSRGQGDGGNSHRPDSL